MQISRRQIVPLVAGSAFALTAGRAFAADRLRIGKAIGSSFPFAGADLGKKKGFFAAENIDAEISVFRGDGQLQQALAAGAVDIGLGSGPGMGYAAKGVPAIAVAALAKEPRNMSLVVAKDGPVRTIADLKGRRIGVTTAGSLTDWLTRRLSESQGWGPEGIEVTPLGDMRTRLAAMKAGEIAGSVNSIEETLNLVENGQGRLLTTFGDALPDFETHVIFAQRDLINKNPDLLKRFLRAWFTTVKFMKDHRAETVKIIAATMKLPESVVDKSYDYEMQMISTDGAFDLKGIDIIRQSLKDLHILDRVPAASELYQPGFVPVRL
jgi:NitT/TauT family transport system substrate-binding protein